jgi:hypothetical protein
VLLAAGSTIGGHLQPRPYNAMTGTVSALAALGAANRWVMTLAFAAAGACEIATGLALRPAAVAGRLILATGARGPAGRGEPGAHRGWRLAAARADRGGGADRDGGLDRPRPAARALGAVGAAAPRLGRRFGTLARRLAVVRRRTDRQRRP